MNARIVTLEFLKEIGTDVELVMNQNNGIVTVTFRVNGIPFEGQYSDTHDGIYAIGLPYETDAVALFELLCLDTPKQEKAA